MNYTLHFDGSCWVNPGGTAAYGTVVTEEGLEICAEAGITGTGPKMSNNVAEFHALSMGLQRLIEFVPEHGSTLEVFGDSNLVIQIMQGNWRPTCGKLYYEWYLQTKSLVNKLQENFHMTIVFNWIPRELNTKCDDLSKAHNKTS